MLTQNIILGVAPMHFLATYQPRLAIFQARQLRTAPTGIMSFLRCSLAQKQQRLKLLNWNRLAEQISLIGMTAAQLKESQL